MKIAQKVNTLTCPAARLAGYYKAIGKTAQESYGLFVRDRGLKPEIDMKAFAKIFESASPCDLYDYEDMDVQWTHFDILRQCHVMIISEDGIFKMVWEDGGTGSHPPRYPPNPERFMPL